MEIGFWGPLIEWVRLNPEWVALSIFIVAFLESLAIAGLLVPGVFLLLGITGIAGSVGLELWPLLIYGFVGAVLGDLISFYLGRYYHQHIKDLRPFRTHPHWIRNGEEYFKKHGGKSVVIGRFFGPVRSIIPLIAGMLDMSPAKFTLINIISAIGWAPVYIIPGFVAGLGVKEGIFPPGTLNVLIWLVVIIVIGFYALIKSHEQLQPGTWLYARFKQWTYQSTYADTLWRKLISHRPGEQIFPLARLVLFIGSLVVFVILSTLVEFTDTFVSTNQSLYDWLKEFRHLSLDQLMVAITLLGDNQLLTILSVLIIIWLFLNKYFIAGLHWIIGLILAALLANGFKWVFAIARPITNVEFLSQYAYPSGHVLGSVAFYGLLVLFVGRESPANKRWVMYLLATIFVSLIGFSRLYLGVHWMTDVLGGVLFGLVMCSGISLNYNRYDIRPIKFNISLAICIIIGIGAIATYMYLNFGDAFVRYQSLTNLVAD